MTGHKTENGRKEVCKNFLLARFERALNYRKMFPSSEFLRLNA
jgi:hypothetical protein